MITNLDISLDVVAFTIAVGTGSFFTYKHFLRPVYKGITKIVANLYKIDDIYQQMHTNGGSTLRDAINRIENRIVTVEQTQNLYLQDASHGIYKTDKDGRWLSVNRTYCRLLGVTEREVLGNGWKNCIHESDRQRVISAWDFALENNIEFNLTYKMMHTDKDIIDVHGVANPIISILGQTIGYLGTIEEIKIPQVI